MFGIMNETVNVKNDFEEGSGVIVVVISYEEDGVTPHETHEISPTVEEQVEVPNEDISFKVEGEKYQIEYKWTDELFEWYRHLEGETRFTDFYLKKFGSFSRLLVRILRLKYGPDDNVSVGPNPS